jgi:uncharacterized coiled-coil DUF342 family protein
MTPVEEASQARRDSDSLDSLEERIQQTVDLVSRLRRERDAAVDEASQAKASEARLAAEVKALQAERKQVRARIERLLEQIGQLGGS